MYTHIIDIYNLNKYNLYIKYTAGKDNKLTVQLVFWPLNSIIATLLKCLMIQTSPTKVSLKALGRSMFSSI